jgi:hypothetical protein
MDEMERLLRSLGGGNDHSPRHPFNCRCAACVEENNEFELKLPHRNAGKLKQCIADWSKPSDICVGDWVRFKKGHAMSPAGYAGQPYMVMQMFDQVRCIPTDPTEGGPLQFYPADMLLAVTMYEQDGEAAEQVAEMVLPSMKGAWSRDYEKWDGPVDADGTPIWSFPWYK